MVFGRSWTELGLKFRGVRLGSIAGLRGLTATLLRWTIGAFRACAAGVRHIEITASNGWKARTESAGSPNAEGAGRPAWSTLAQRATMDPMSKPAIRVSEAEAANDFPSLHARVRAGAEAVIERDAEAVAVIRPAAPHVRLLSESLRLAKERGSNATLDGGFGRDLEAVVSSHREPLTPPAWG